jgi:peptide/nickel transport system substrate-binding protein
LVCSNRPASPRSCSHLGGTSRACSPSWRIVRAERPRSPGKRCDLSDGIEVDNRTRTITIHLTEPDPEFLYKLALPLASLVPAGTPLHAARAQPIPSTGPYRVASLDPDRELRLVRNEHFSMWSADARPNGYPDEIRFHLSHDAEARLAAVEKGAADFVSLVGPVVLTRATEGRAHALRRTAA